MIIDSSVIIAYFYEQDSQHDKARMILDDLFEKEQKICFTDFVFSEIITVINLRAGYEKAKMVSDKLLNNKDVNLLCTDFDVFRKTMKRFESKITKLSFVDISLIEVAHEQDKKLITFDRELQKEYAKTLISQ